jgi:hypothetical protein
MKEKRRMRKETHLFIDRRRNGRQKEGKRIRRKKKTVIGRDLV